MRFLKFPGDCLSTFLLMKNNLFRFRIKSLMLVFSIFTFLPDKVIANQDLVLSPDTSLVSSYLKRAQSQSASSSDSAIYYFQKAITLSSKGVASSISKNLRNKSLRQLIKSELGLGLIYYQILDYPKAMMHYERAYKSAKVLGLSFYQAECLFNFAEVHLEQSHYTEAMARYFEAIQEYNKTKNKSGIYWCYIGMGIAQKQCGNFNDAIICYENALAIAVEGKMKIEVAYCYNNLGNVYRQQGNFVKSMDAYEKALSEFNSMKDDLSVSDCLNNIGNLYLDKGDPFRSLDYFNRSINFIKVKSDNYRMIGRYKNMAEAYSALNDFTNASLFLEKALKLAEKSDDKTLLASCYSLIGDLHFKNGNHEIGISYIKKSLEIFHAIGAKAEEAEVLVELANAEFLANRTEEALAHSELGEQIARDAGAVKTIVSASDCLAKIWEKKDNPQKALHYVKMVLHLQDSILSVEKNRAIEEIEAGFTRTRLINENQLLAQNSKLQQQTLKTRNFAVLALALCLLLSLALIWLIYKRHIDAKAMAGRERALKEKEIEKLSDDLSLKERELTTKTLLINQKNGLLQKLIDELETLKENEGNSTNRIGRLQHELKQELSPNAWKEFEVQFNEVHPGFQNRLLERFPELSPTERRICTFLRLDMNTREMASLTGQSSKSLEVARTRIRKKMDLPHEGNLSNFIALI
jgi:tetratricopeptide (TPR) repeat protein